MLAQLLTETLFGALTGYITNDTAIRSMFQPGGVIEKTRDDFAREAGLLLEEQVLTRAVLEQQIALPQVQTALSELLQDFLQKRLPEAMEQQNLQDLPDSDTIASFLKELVVEFLQQEQEQILILLKRYLPVELVLTDAQCNQLGSQLEKILLETLQQEKLISRFWYGWREEHGSQSMEQMGLGSFCDTLIKNAAAKSRNWPQMLKQQYGEELEKLLQESISTLELQPILLEIDGVMTQYSLRQYLNVDEAELAETVQRILASENGQELLKQMAGQLLQAVETIDMPVAQIIPEDLLKELVPLLQQAVPATMERVLEWLRQNSNSLNEMLNQAVDEVSEEIGGMKGMLLEQLKETVLAQVLGENNLVDFMQETVLNEQTTSEAVAILMEMIQQLLTEQTLGDLIRKLNEKQTLETVFNLMLTENLQRMMNRYGQVWMQKLLDWKPGSLQLAARQPKIEEILVRLIAGGVQQVNLEALVLQFGNRVKQAELSDLLNMDAEQLQEVAEQAVQYGCRYLAERLPQCRADELYRPLYDAMEQMLNQNGQQWIRNLMAEYTVKDLVTVVEKRMQDNYPQLVELLSQVGLNVMEGQLSKLAENQIQQLSNEDMLKLVQDLMGRELKPLNYLGAGMGAIAGATVGTALSAALPMTAAAGPALMASVLAGKSAVFGAVGYTTNCAAVKGLFWPYEPLGGIEMIQGVIPKQKARFAHSMGNMVDRYVINETVLQELLQKAEPDLQAYGKELANHEQLLQRAAAELAAHRNDIVQPLVCWLEQNGQQKLHEIMKKLGGMPFAFLRTSIMDGRLLEQQILPMAERWLNQQMHSPVTIKQLVDEKQFWHLIEPMLTGINMPDLQNLSRQALNSEQTAEQLLGDSMLQTLLQGIKQYLGEWLQQKQNQERLVALAGKVLSAERFKQWLENNSGTWIEENLSSIFGIVERMLLQLMQEKQHAITSAVQASILNGMGLMQRMGYAMMNGDAIVARIVDRVVQQKLPIFLSVKGRELQGLFRSCWDDIIFPAVMQVPIKQNEMETVMQTLLEQPVVHSSAVQISEMILNKAAALPVRTWGAMLQPDALMERVQILLGFQWQKNAEAVITMWMPLAQRVYTDFVSNITLQELTQGYQETVSLQKMLQYEGLSELLRGLQLRLQENIAITRPEHWLNWPEVIRVLDNAVYQLLQEDATGQWMRYKGEVLVLQVAEHWDRILPAETRSVLLQPALQAVFETAEAYGTKLLQAMDLAQLAEKQLIAMDSAHLERVVRSFAGHYLVHIENRGWMGAVFALPGMLVYLF